MILSLCTLLYCIFKLNQNLVMLGCVLTNKMSTILIIYLFCFIFHNWHDYQCLYLILGFVFYEKTWCLSWPPPPPSSCLTPPGPRHCQGTKVFCIDVNHSHDYPQLTLIYQWHIYLASSNHHLHVCLAEICFWCDSSVHLLQNIYLCLLNIYFPSIYLYYLSIYLYRSSIYHYHLSIGLCHWSIYLFCLSIYLCHLNIYLADVYLPGSIYPVSICLYLGSIYLYPGICLYSVSLYLCLLDSLVCLSGRKSHQNQIVC